MVRVFILAADVNISRSGRSIPLRDIAAGEDVWVTFAGSPYKPRVRAVTVRTAKGRRDRQGPGQWTPDSP